MVVYAAVPTSGLPAESAKDYASLLQYAATAGQQPGLGVGQLPPGYLPMTKANGLAGLADYTLGAVADVAAQNGELPSMTSPLGQGGTKPPPTTIPTSTTTSTTTPPAHTSGTKPPSRTGHPAPRPVSVGILSLGRALGADLGTGPVSVVLTFGLALLCLLAVSLTYLVGRRRGRW
jgi:hypothetical protein